VDELTTEQLELLADIHDYELELAILNWQPRTPQHTQSLATTHCGWQTAPAGTTHAMQPR
jgi:hypothetical protein